MRKVFLWILIVGSVTSLTGCPPLPQMSPHETPVSSAPPVTPNLPSPNLPGKEDPDAPREFTTTKSGLKYRILRKGNGKKPRLSNEVTVHYRGTLDDGTQFDSSYDRGEPTSFPLSGVVQGWQEGLQLIDQGGMIELEIPSELGYGERGAGGSIPPNATLHFVVELFKIQ